MAWLDLRMASTKPDSRFLISLVLFVPVFICVPFFAFLACRSPKDFGMQVAVPSGVKAADGQEGAATVMARRVLSLQCKAGVKSIQHQSAAGALCDLPFQLFSAAPSNPTNCDV